MDWPDNTLEQTLDQMAKIVLEYRAGAYLKHSTLLRCQRDLACLMYDLGEWQVYYHDEYVKLYHEMKNDFPSHAATERECEKLVPELYMCRKLLDRATTVSIAMQNDLKHIEKS